MYLTGRRPYRSSPQKRKPPLLQRIAGSGHRYLPGRYGLISYPADKWL